MDKIFEYEKLDVFPVSVELVALIDETCKLMPRGGNEIGDELQKMVKSIPMSIAVAYTSEVKEERILNLKTAKNTTINIAAMLDVCMRLEMVDYDHLQANRDLIERTAILLMKMIKAES
ncbi:MAG: four helix bundle protein [bacterium]|nr:four helix bundle protein [bacterium]MBU1916489.1 four helix bundle protein [bacterium]